MTDQQKRCTKCGETKPLVEFHLRQAGDPSGPRRATCKACDAVERQRRRAEGESVMSELLRVGISNLDLLSEKAREAVSTEEPIDPALIAMARARQAKEAERQRRAELRRLKEVRPSRLYLRETDI